MQNYLPVGKYDFNKLPQIMANEGVTVSLMVPSILYMLITSPGATDVLFNEKYYQWIYWVAPILGGALGALSYKYMYREKTKVHLDE